MTFKFIIKILILLVFEVAFGLFLSSCGRSYIISKDLNMLEKGKSIGETEEIIGRAPKEVFSFNQSEKFIDLCIYPMLYNQYSYTTHSYDAKGNHTTHTVKVVETRDFGIMYVDGRLHNTFWITHVNKQEDDLTQRVAPKIVEKYFEKYLDE
jgi:hypothetical protein